MLNYKNKSTGNLSFLVSLMDFIGALARGYTIVISSGDLNYMVFKNNFEKHFFPI